MDKINIQEEVKTIKAIKYAREHTTLSMHHVANEFGLCPVKFHIDFMQSQKGKMKMKMYKELEKENRRLYITLFVVIFFAIATVATIAVQYDQVLIKNDNTEHNLSVAIAKYTVLQQELADIKQSGLCLERLY